MNNEIKSPLSQIHNFSTGTYAFLLGEQDCRYSNSVDTTWDGIHFVIINM